MEGLPLFLLLEDLEELEKETLRPGVSRFPSDVLGRCQRLWCDIAVVAFRSLELWGSCPLPCLGRLRDSRWWRGEQRGSQRAEEGQ